MIAIQIKNLLALIGMEFVRLSHRRPIEVSDVCRQNILQYFCIAVMLISEIMSILFLNKDLKNDVLVST